MPGFVDRDMRFELIGQLSIETGSTKKFAKRMSEYVGCSIPDAEIYEKAFSDKGGKSVVPLEYLATSDYAKRRKELYGKVQKSEESLGFYDAEFAGQDYMLTTFGFTKGLGVVVNFYTQAGVRKSGIDGREHNELHETWNKRMSNFLMYVAEDEDKVSFQRVSGGETVRLVTKDEHVSIEKEKGEEITSIEAPVLWGIDREDYVEVVKIE